MVDASGKMRMEKCGWKNVDGKMRKDAKKVKKNKTNKADGRNE